MKKLLVSILTILALGAFASSAFADPNGSPNTNASDAAGSSSAHGAGTNNVGNASGGDNGADTDPRPANGNDSEILSY